MTEKTAYESSAELHELWNKHVVPLFPKGAGCACPGTCGAKGFCPVTGHLTALTPNEAETYVSRDKEVADALHWWRAIKAKRAQSSGS
jgi:hypothetical protein